MKKLFLLQLFLFIFIGLSAKNIPEWVKKRPISKDYYIGIGVAKIDKNNTDYIQLAKDNALKNLASEIKVTISSEVLSSVSEINGKLKELVQSDIKTSTKANLEGFELVDTYKDKKNYWVYYRLSKQLYEQNKRKRINKAVGQSLAFYKEAMNFINKNDIVSGVDFLFQALDVIKAFPNEKTDINGKSVYLFNEIISSIKTVFSNINLNTDESKISVKINKKIENYPQVTAFYKEKNRRIPNLPLIVKFIKGGGDVLPQEVTNQYGIAKIHLTKVTSPEKLQILSIKVNNDKIIGKDSLSVMDKTIVSGLPVASAKIFLNVTGMVFYIESTEKNMGKELQIKYLEPQIKEELSKDNISFTDDPSKADGMITVNAKTYKGGDLYGLYSSYADVSVSIMDLKEGKELYKNTFSKIKGIDKDFVKAGKKALSNAAKEIIKSIKPIIKTNF